MQKTILITGATDGIGLETAKMLRSKDHNLLIHGRNKDKMRDVEAMLNAAPGNGSITSFLADLSNMTAVQQFANEVLAKSETLDVIINNAGIFKTNHARTDEGLDVRFAVNTLAPYLLTKALIPLLGPTGRVVNLSSAAQAPVSLEALAGNKPLSDMEAYSQSKLAITQWTKCLADTLTDGGPMIVAVNPGSLLASKMVKEGFGVSGNDLSIGVDILCRAALSDEFTNAGGKYFDNDAGKFSMPHPDGVNVQKSEAVTAMVETVLSKLL